MNRVLLVCNESTACRSLARTLGGLGFGVDVAWNGPVGLTYAGQRRYSHVLIDRELFPGDALALFRQMQQIQQATVGILLTTVANINTVYEAIEAGMRRVLAKPIDYDQLLPLLDPSLAETKRTFTESEIAAFCLADIHEGLSEDELIDIIRSVDYPFAGKHRLEHFDRDTLERVVHLITRWCRQRQRRAQELAAVAR